MHNELPTLDQLVEFFGVDPSDVIPDEGLSVFRLSEGSIRLTVSISEIARSFQTNIYIDDTLLSSVVFEGLEELLLLGDKAGSFMLAKFAAGDAVIKCDIRVRPGLRVGWSGITS